MWGKKQPTTRQTSFAIEPYNVKDVHERTKHRKSSASPFKEKCFLFLHDAKESITTRKESVIEIYDVVKNKVQWMCVNECANENNWGFLRNIICVS